MNFYKVNDKLYVDLDKLVAIEDIVNSYKLVMEGNTIITLEKKEYDKIVNLMLDEKCAWEFK